MTNTPLLRLQYFESKSFFRILGRRPAVTHNITLAISCVSLSQQARLRVFAADSMDVELRG